VSEVSARGQHAHREKHDGDDADVRKLPPHLGHRCGVAATGDPGKDSGRTARSLIQRRRDPRILQFGVQYAFSIESDSVNISHQQPGGIARLFLCEHVMTEVDRA